MENTNALLGALPLLAQALGRKYGVKVSLRGNGAYTTGDEIVLPALPAEDKNLAPLLMGYLDHECGHVRETDFDLFRTTVSNPLLKHVLNTLEDVRIEKRMGEIFPGCRTNLARLVKLLVQDGSFGPVAEADPGQLVSGYLLYSLRSRVVGQTGLNDLSEDAAEKLDRAYPGLRDELDRETAEIEKAKETKDCLDISQAVLEALRRYMKEPPPQPESDESEQGQNSEESPSSDSSEEQEEGESDENQESKGSGQAGGGEDEESESEEQSEDSSSSENAESNSSSEGDAEGCEQSAACGSGSSGESENGWSQEQAKTLQEALDADEEDLVQNLGELIQEKVEEATEEAERNGMARSGSSEPCSDESTFTMDESKVRAATNALRTRLHGLLQAKSDVRNMPRRTGRKLDSRKIARIRAGVEQRVFRGRNERQGLNTAVHVLLDRSGSMQGYPMEVANECMLAVKVALSGLNQVNLGISAFPGRNGAYHSYTSLVRHGQRRGNDIGLTADGGTPLGEALWGVANQMIPLSESRKIIIVLTDGNPHNSDGAANAIRLLNRTGFELVGVGIQHPDVQKFFKNFCVVHDLQDLPTALFEQLERLLVK